MQFQPSRSRQNASSNAPSRGQHTAAARPAAQQGPNAHPLEGVLFTANSAEHQQLRLDLATLSLSIQSTFPQRFSFLQSLLSQCRHVGDAILTNVQSEIFNIFHTLHPSLQLKYESMYPQKWTYTSEGAMQVAAQIFKIELHRDLLSKRGPGAP